MMSGGNFHAAGASNSVRAKRLCPKTVARARRSSSVSAVSGPNPVAFAPWDRTALPISGEEATRTTGCRNTDGCASPSRERRGSMLRSPGPQTRFDDYDFSDFAQEFLRRNPDYREQFVRWRRAEGGQSSSAAVRRAARSWGLEFLRRPDATRRCLPGLMASRRQSGCGPRGTHKMRQPVRSGASCEGRPRGSEDGGRPSPSAGG